MRRPNPPTDKAIIAYWSRPWKAGTSRLEIYPDERCCFACGYDFDYLEKAHLIDHSASGSSTVDNLVLLCSHCHSMMPPFRDGEKEMALQWVANQEPWDVWMLRQSLHNPSLVSSCAHNLVTVAELEEAIVKLLADKERCLYAYHAQTGSWRNDRYVD